MEEKLWLEFVFVVYLEDSSNLPSRTNEVIRLEKGLLAACKGEDTFLLCFLIDSFHEVKLCTFLPSHAQRLMVLEAKKAGEGKGMEKLRGKIGRGTDRFSNASPPPPCHLPVFVPANLILSDLFCGSCAAVTEIKNALVLLPHFSRVLKNSRVLIQLNNARGTSFFYVFYKIKTTTKGQEFVRQQKWVRILIDQH